MDEKIGLIAGKGKLPEIILRELLKKKIGVYTVALKGFGSPDLVSLSSGGEIFKIGEVGKILNFFKEKGVNKLIMAGKVEHINIFKDFSADFKAFSLLKELKNKNTLSIYSLISDFLKKNGISLLDYDWLLKDYIPSKGILVGRVGKKTMDFLNKGFSIAKRIAELDIGQAISFKDGVVIGVEAVEGTDEMIKRSGSLIKDFFIIKVSNPHQSMSFDMPVVGKNTLKNIYESGGKGLVIEGGKTIVLDLEESMEYAKRQKLILVAL